MDSPVQAGFVSEFLEFIKKYQVIGLAVAFVIGTAATKMVTSLTNDIVMPIVNALLPGGDWATAYVSVGPVKFLWGDLLNAIINFLIVALVVYFIVKFIMKEDATQKR